MNILYIGSDLVKKTNYNSSMNTMCEHLTLSGFHITRASSKNNKVLRLLDMLLKVLMYHKKVSYVIIDTFSTSNFYYALLVSQLARLLNLQYIPILRGGNLPSRLLLNKNLSNLLFRYSYKNIAPSNYLKSEFLKNGFSAELIPNIIDVDNYKFKSRKVLQPNLLWVRAFDKIYNPTLAIKVFSLLKNNYPNAKLTMVGPKKDNSFDEVLKLIKNLKLEESINITGVLKKEEWHKLAEDSDIFINTTNIDNTPVSVLEAMALGLPVVSTNVGGLPYLIENNIDGILVKKDDAKLMYNAIKHLLTNKDVAIEIANKARSKIESYSWRVIEKEWLNLLDT